jgi:Peptidase M66
VLQAGSAADGRRLSRRTGVVGTQLTSGGTMDVDERFLAELNQRRLADFTRIPLAWISGVEVTQSIQYYKASEHLTDPNDRGSDNSVRLVASKPAWVRVYYRSILARRPTVTLDIQRRMFGFLWTHVASYTSPGSVGPVVASASAASLADYTSERSDVSSTINFVIPASQFLGNLRLRIRLSAAGSTDTETVFVNAALRQTMRLRVILVSYNGPSTANVPAGSPAPPNVNLAAPTLTDAHTTSALARLMMPVRSMSIITGAGTLAWTRPLDDPRTSAGGCSNNWNALLAQLGNIRTNDGNRANVVYYGLLPAAIPLGVPGCGVGGLGAGIAGDQGTLVHEIGHGYGFQHTPCGNAGTTDANYPTYEPYPSASIGEFGLNISNGTVYPPANTSDYMSYCFPQWMSLYQHNRLINHARLNPESVGDEPLWLDGKLQYREYMVERDLPRPPDPRKRVESRLNQIISVTGIVHAADDIEVMTVARVEAAGSPAGERTALTVQLLNEDGRVVSAAPLMRLRTHGDCGCGCGGEDGDEGAEYAFQAYLPNLERGAALRIREGEKTVWERRAPDGPPEIGRVSPDIDGEGRLRLHWETDADDEGAETWVQWSDDRGETWQGLTTGLRGRDAAVDLAGLPSGDVQVRLLVSNGFDTTVSRPIRVPVPDRAPDVVILAPADGDMLITGRPMRLWAQASEPDGTPLDEASGQWSVDREDAGTGFESWIPAPPAGEHRVTFALDRGRKASVSFRTIDPEADFASEVDREPDPGDGR